MKLTFKIIDLDDEQATLELNGEQKIYLATNELPLGSAVGDILEFTNTINTNNSAKTLLNEILHPEE